MTSREVRDAVHGLIELRPREWDLVDTRAFQRLRRVKQLAMTDLVYPGARHSRFEHCVGAAHMAGRTGDSVNAHAGGEPIDVERLRAAALLHDVGHGPFSHVSEMVFEKRTGRRKIHESISAAVIRHDAEVRQVLGDADAEWIADLLTGSGHGSTRSVERDVVAGPADIDKLDYLLRDSHYCGVNYGRYDKDKLIESARLQPDVGGGSKLAFHTDGIYALEEMLLARYHMHRQVYGHKTRVATDIMLVRAMDFGVDEELLPEPVFAPPEEPDAAYVAEYLRFDDEAVIRALTAHPDSRSGEIMQALVDRKLMKRVGRMDFAELDYRLGREMAGFIVDPDEAALDALPQIEDTIASTIGVPAHWVAVFHDRLSNPVLRPYTARIEGDDIVLVGDDGRVHVFHDASEVFTRGEGEQRRSVSLYVRPPDDDRGRLDDHVVAQAFLDGLATLGEIARQI